MRKKLFKKVVAYGIATVLCINSVYAMSTTESNMEIEESVGKHVFVDGVEYTISIDDNFNISVYGETDSGSAQLTLDTSLEGELIIEDDSHQEKYNIDIDSLSVSDESIDSEGNTFTATDSLEYEELSISVTDENDNTIVYNNIDDVIEEKYSGQMAAVAVYGGTIVISGVLTALLKACIVVMVSGVACYALQEVVTNIQRKSNCSYYRAYLASNTVVINPKPISKAEAANRVRNGGNIYTFYQSNAHDLMYKVAGYAFYGPEHHKKWYSVGWYFKHYHLNSHKNRADKNKSHVFFGFPVR